METNELNTKIIDIFKGIPFFEVFISKQENKEDIVQFLAGIKMTVVALGANPEVLRRFEEFRKSNSKDLQSFLKDVEDSNK